MTSTIEVNCSEFIATVSLDRATGDSVPVLRIAQDDEFVILDATDLDPLLAAIQSVKEALVSRPQPHEYGNSLHPARNALRTAFVGAVVAVTLLLPATWALQTIGALK